MFKIFKAKETPYKNLTFDQIRKKDFPQLSDQDHTYLDFTGGGLYALRQIEMHHELLRNNIFGNPHSINPSSSFSTKLVEQTRNKVLEFFNATDYECIFTMNASGALKIVGECYPFDENSLFVLSKDNHNSVLGIKEQAKRKKAQVDFIDLNEDMTISQESFKSLVTTQRTASNKLLAFPAQSNYSGVKHSLEMVRKAQENGFKVLLDAAAYCPTNILDLKETPVDFVCVSFYKMFGYPTGIGCLLVKKGLCEELNKSYFAGGTVKVASTYEGAYALHNNHERFEDGTINYNQIPAVGIGLDYLNDIGMRRIQQQVKNNTSEFYQRLDTLTHSNGAGLIKFVGKPGQNNHGSTLSFHVLNSKGEKICLDKIEQLAAQRHISLRTGCFCNPGADESFHQIGQNDVTELIQAIDCEDQNKITLLKSKRGAVRISVGMITNNQDLESLTNFLISFSDMD
ncbi:aminotransferase class V-fold PLP-dependent enzyme [Jiulongibacter sp. NS-SX5]|uniref:aminotransferase class V-fold PLP-dependent enzyme n=1 Tax=Jiulongibacter sp. NS-SX5 TaxID=3463854 RepID=UPI004058A1B4